jgi:hypothetical protein
VDDKEIATKFYLKNGFNVENSEFSLILDKPKYGQFGYLYKGEEAITRREYLSF